MEENEYKFPSNNILMTNDFKIEIDKEHEKVNIERFFESFRIDIECKDVYVGINSITYILDLKCKNRVSTIESYKDDLLLYFNAVDINFKVAINGTPYLGIHIIKAKEKTLFLGNLIQDKEFIESTCKIPIIIGKNFENKLIIEDLTQLPHLLVAGSTGTGKSNFLSTIIVDIVYKLNPDEVKIFLVDTRKTNFERFNLIPHLLVPTITDCRKAIGILAFLEQEMRNRYQSFKEKRVDNIDEYNRISEIRYPRFVAIIEDFYDLMMEEGKAVEEYMQLLIPMCRAAGIHVIISTQRPSVDAITGVIKANIPARITFKLPSKADSKTVIDIAGAESLLLYGDVLFSKIGERSIERIQTPFISDLEIQNVVDAIKNDNIREVFFQSDIEKDKDQIGNLISESDEIDPFLFDAMELVINIGYASPSIIQRTFKVGYARAGRIIDQLELLGIISGYNGSKPRDVLITKNEFKELRKKLEI